MKQASDKTPPPLKLKLKHLFLESQKLLIKEGKENRLKEAFGKKEHLESQSHISTTLVEPNDGDEYNRYSKKGAYGFSRNMKLEEMSVLTSYFSEIWKKVNFATDYPENFIRQRIVGEVHVHLNLNEKGIFVGDFLSIESSEPLLETYVVSLLLYALKDPLRKSLWLKKKKNIPSVFSFYFNTMELKSNQKEIRRGFHIKNIFVFRRKEYMSPKILLDVARFLNKYIPPIIPLPGGFYIDFVRAYTFIRDFKDLKKPVNWKEQKRARKLKLLRNKLELTIKKERQNRKKK